MKLQTNKRIEIRQPRYHKGLESQMDDNCQWIVDQISQRFRNGVLKSLNKRVVDKFEDAQVGNYAVVTRQLARKVFASVRRQFGNARIQKMVKATLTNADKFNREQFYRQIERSLGYSTEQLIAQESMTEDFNALVVQTTEWVQKLRDETMEFYTANVIRAMTLGESLESIMGQFDGMVEKRKGAARQNARDQIAHFNAVTGKIRAQDAGVRKAIWRTNDDSKVRHSHELRDGKEFDLDTGLYSSSDGLYLIPGVDYNCRCWAEYVLED